MMPKKINFTIKPTPVLRTPSPNEMELQKNISLLVFTPCSCYNEPAVLHGDLANLLTRTLMRGAEPAVRGIAIQCMIF